MKILLIHNAYQQPGGEDVVFDAERQLLARSGHQVLTYQRSNWEIERLSRWGRLALGYRTVWNAATRRELLGLLRRERPDVVHVHNTFIMISPSIFSACREARVPAVLSVHNYRLFCPAATFFREGQVCEECRVHSLWRGVRHGCYHASSSATAVVALMLAVNRRRSTWTGNVDRFIALTDFSRRKLMAGGIPEARIMVKPNFVHPDPGAGLGARRYALFVGRLSPEKGPAVALEGVEGLPVPIPLRVLGAGPERPSLEAQAGRDGLAQAQFEGQRSRPETLAALQGARFLVFPSLWYENFPMTIAEAFACGTPVIASRLGAVEEIVHDRRTGLHFNPGDAGDLAAKVLWAWNHPRELEEMGRQARREFEAKYTAETNYPMLMNIYEQAIRHQQRQPTAAHSMRVAAAPAADREARS